MDAKVAEKVLNVVGDKRQEVVELVGVLFDAYVEPIDLPGPDTVVDPAVRSGLTLIVGWGFDSIVAKIRESAGIVASTPEKPEGLREAMLSVVNALCPHDPDCDC